MSVHLEFINKPISNILDEAITSSSGIGKGIELYPLGEYILQSVFLKMTGFQEQKMKCIVWEMSTNDFDYRRILLYDAKYGEYADYKSKKNIYTNLIILIKKLDENYDIQTLKSADKEEIISESIADVRDSFKDTNISKFEERDYNYFCKFISSKLNDFMSKEQIIPNEKNLFESSLQNFYEGSLYKQRNRLAHNTMSYQQNLPTLESLRKEKEGYRNYFIWFTVLILIDKIFMRLFQEYQNLLKDSIY